MATNCVACGKEKALGVPEDYAYGTIRISLGKENTEDEIEEIFIAINEIVKSLTV
mgnify:CR=1 FL=1